MTALYTLEPLNLPATLNLHPRLIRGATALRAEGIFKVSDKIKRFLHNPLLLRNRYELSISRIVKTASPKFITYCLHLAICFNKPAERGIVGKGVHPVSEDLELVDQFFGGGPGYFLHSCHNYLYALIVYITTYLPTRYRQRKLDDVNA